MRKFLFSFCILSLFLSACARSASTPPAPSDVASQPAVGQATPTLEATATLAPSIWITPSAPRAVRAPLDALKLPTAVSLAAASVRLEIANQKVEVEDQQVSTWFYAVVAPFPTVVDKVSFPDLKGAWEGKRPFVFSDEPLVMTRDTYEAMKTLFGSEAAAGSVQIVPADELVDALWRGLPQWGIVPFEALDPKLKVLALGSESPIRKDFNADKYPLKLEFSCSGAACSKVNLPKSNRDPSKLTTLIMTGVTAMVRATAYKMDTEGVLSPGAYIRDAMREADIAHISNEIPFAQNCPKPVWNSKRLIFCSDPKYIELLDDLGTDVVELTGNHMEDWGQQAMRYSLQLYKEHGMAVYGGGADLTAAHTATVVERNGVKFAFVGCNPVGPDFAWADVDWPGAAPCGDYKWMTAEIKRMKSLGCVVIASFQYYEYYTPEPRPRQQEVFRMMAEAGADVVSGSQAHSAQAMEFDGSSFIHYGLGNLFFDQMNVTDYSRYEFLDRYVFYNGHLVSVDLVTAMLEDYARPGPMNPAQRADLLTYIFRASGWLPKSEGGKPRPTPTLVGFP